MAASALGPDGTPVLSAECKWKMLAHGEGQGGSLFLTSLDKLVFVTCSGFLSKKYKKSHSIDASDILNARTEEGFLGLGTCLVVEWNFEGNNFTYRYEGVQNPEEWVNRIAELTKVAREFHRAYDRIVRLIRSQETTSFDQIEENLSSMWPDFANKTIEEKDREIVDFLSRCIDQGRVQGFVDASNRQFTHLVAYKQKSPVTKEREVIKETVVMVPCAYCGGLMPNTSIFCPHCGAKRRA